MAVSTEPMDMCGAIKSSKKEGGHPSRTSFKGTSHCIAFLGRDDTTQVEGNAEEYYHKPYLVSQSNVIDGAMYIVRNRDFVVAEAYNTNNTV